MTEVGRMVALTFSVSQPTMELRVLVPSMRLQQKWVCTVHRDGKPYSDAIEWRDVPRIDEATGQPLPT